VTRQPKDDAEATYRAAVRAFRDRAHDCAAALPKPMERADRRAMWEDVRTILHAFVAARARGTPWGPTAVQAFGALVRHAAPDGEPGLEAALDRFSGALSARLSETAFPLEVAQLLAERLDELLAGRMPPDLDELRSRASAYGPREWRCIAAAVLYVRAARHPALKRYIADPKPVDTVKREFGGPSNETWKDWKRRVRGRADLSRAADVERLLETKGRRAALAMREAYRASDVDRLLKQKKSRAARQRAGAAHPAWEETIGTHDLEAVALRIRAAMHAAASHIRARGRVVGATRSNSTL
jgi:hypothetical protein